MSSFHPLFKNLVLFLLILNSNTTISGQSKQLVKHIQKQLVQIDSLIDSENYNLALIKISEIESYSQYISNKNNKLNLDLKKAKAYYGMNEAEISMSELLNGLNELKDLEIPKLKYEYNEYLAEIFLKSKDHLRSLKYLNNGLSIANKLNDTLSILNSYYSIGRIYFELEKNDSAIYFYKKVIDYPISKKTANIIARSYTSLSGQAGAIGDLELSLQYANKALDIRKEQKDTVGIAYALSNLSAVYYDQSQYQKAFDNYLEAYQSVENMNSEGALSIKENLLYNMAYSNEMLGSFESAYKYLEKASNLKDSLGGVNIARNISEIQAKYNVAKLAKEAEEEKSIRQRTQFYFYASVFVFISMLVLSYIFYRNYRLKREREVDKLVNDSQIKIINATIDAKEQERKSIAEILHDSVSALLSSANLHLQATKAQLKTGYPQEITKAQTIVNEASVKIRDLSHELISSILLKFGLAFAVHDMCQKYSNSEISLFSDDDGVKRYEQNFEIKIHSIIEELVNNILKHSKAKNATIMLAHRENNMLSIRMNDDGVGFDAKTAKTKGGLGLSHIDARITVMKGVFNIVSSKDAGTSIFILVPIVPIA